MNFEIKIVQGNDARKLLNDQDFIDQWNNLARMSEKVSVMQEYPFVNTWYKVYANVFEPILILGFDSKSKLIGFLPLSLEHGSLIHAGGMQAEYHGWLAKKELDQDFIVQAIIAIKQNLKVKKWKLGWAPPKSNLDWLTSKALKKEGIYVKSFEEDSPLIDLYDEDKIEKLKKSRSTRNKINRYIKKGDFYIERITDKDKAKKILDTLANQCDFRKITVNHEPLFINDPYKKQFLIEKLDYPKNTHFTILWSNDTPIAYHIGECDTNTVYLTLISHHPIEAKNSPGKILIIKLAELLKKEGFRYFDLTPGGDEYKETYSNSSRKIFYLTLYFSQKDKIVSDIKEVSKESLKKGIGLLGLQPTAIATTIAGILASIQKIFKNSPLKSLKKIVSSVYNKNIDEYYRISTKDILAEPVQCDENINVNNYSDFLLEVKNLTCKNTSTLFSKAQRRFNSGDLLYSKVIDGHLAQYGWETKKWQKNIDIEANKELDIPENSVLLNGFITNPDYLKQGLFKEMLKRMLIDNKNNDIKDVFIMLNRQNVSSKAAIEEAGFNVHFKIIKRRFFWKTKTEILN